MYASADEVRQTIGSLTDEELYRLIRLARRYLPGTDYCTADDLVADVLHTTLAAACGGKGRRWRRGVPFRTHLFMTMRGTASDARRSLARLRVRQEHDGGDPCGPPSCTSSVEDEVTDKEEKEQREKQEREQLAKVREYFKDDEQVQWVIQGIKDGQPAQKIREQSGMTQVEYESAHKRWRRGLDGLFPDRRKK